MARSESRSRSHCLTISLLVILIILVGGAAVTFSWYRDTKALNQQEREIERLDAKIDLLRIHVDHQLDLNRADPNGTRFAEILKELEEEFDQKLTALDKRIQVNDEKTNHQLRSISITRSFALAAIISVGLLILLLVVVIVVAVCRRRKKNKSQP